MARARSPVEAPAARPTASGTPQAVPAYRDETRRLLAALDRRPGTLQVGGHAVRLTHLERIYWPPVPELGQPAITKLDLLRYWVRMAPLALPHLRDRPLTLFRWPGGIEGRRILQKHPEPGLPAFVETATVFSETKGHDDAYLLCNNLATLLWLAERGVLEIHAWHSRVGAGESAPVATAAVNRPDYLLFDLDPYLYSGRERQGAEPEPNAAAFEHGGRVALRLHELLRGLGLVSCVKTSGKTGLHVAVPIVPALAYDVVRRIAKTICEHLVREHPDALTTEWSTGKRAGKVFLDFNMNVRGKSIIAPYGPRGLPGAPVSMPLAWRALASADPTRFRVPTLLSRPPRADAWRPVLDDPQDLQATLARPRPPLSASPPRARR